MLGYTRWRRKRVELLEAQSQVVETEAGPVEYQSAGEGLPLLVVHGGPGGHDQGMLYEPLLGEGFRLISPSRPGYLRTPLDTGRTHAAQADALAALLDAIDVAEVVVCGLSAGGPVAVEFAARHPSRTRGLLLECAVSQCYRPEISPLARAIFLSDFGTYLQARLGMKLPKLTAREIVRQESHLRGRELSAAAASIVADPRKLRLLEMLLSSVTPYDLRRAGLENDLEQLGRIEALPFERIQAPTLVLHGTEDADVPIADAELAAASIAGSRLSPIEGGWHVLPLCLQSAEADRERASFLSDL